MGQIRNAHRPDAGATLKLAGERAEARGWLANGHRETEIHRQRFGGLDFRPPIPNIHTAGDIENQSQQLAGV